MQNTDYKRYIVRVQAQLEPNFSVITDEGSFYSFIVNYSENPEKLNIEMEDFLREEKLGAQQENSMEIYLPELDDESLKTVDIVMKRIC